MYDLSPQEQAALDSLMRRFRPEHPTVRVLHHSQGIVAESAGHDAPIILKVMASAAPVTDDLQARLEWIAHLRRTGLQVPELIRSLQGNLVESVEIEGVFYVAYAYVRIPIAAENRIDWGDATMPARLGKIMGIMHRTARVYRPEPGRPRISHWDDADWLREPEKVLHPSQAAIVGAIHQLREVISRFPKDGTNYGLVHDDLHTGNVFRLGDDLAIIDFDCCHYSWFAADISSALLFRVWIGPSKETQEMREEATGFLRRLLEGYRAECDLAPEWAVMMPPLLKLREISLFQSDYRHIDAASSASDALFRYLFESIRENKPFLDIDFGAANH